MRQADAIAALPMYDWPEVGRETDAFWQILAAALAEAGFAAPAALDRQRDEEAVWRDPELVLSQTCGLPFSLGAAGTAIYVATPHYTAPGCGGAEYCSMIVAPKQSHDVAARLAVNGFTSLSGSLAFADWLEARGHHPPTPGQWLVTGSHRGSLAAVARGEAMLGSIDAVAFALATRHDAEIVERVEVIGQTRRYPGLPLITGKRHGSRLEALRLAITTAFREPRLKQPGGALFIDGLSVEPAAAYRDIGRHARRLAARGWPVLKAPEISPPAP